MSEPPRRGPESSFGFVEWFRPGEYARTEACLDQLAGSGACYLRTHLSWAEYHAPGGEEWYDWLIPKLGDAFDLLPCVHYTPPSLSRTGRVNGAPRRLRDYADFVDLALTRYGAHFRDIELWNEPNNLLDWDWRSDTDFSLFCEMVGDAAYWARERGFRPVLGGPCPFDPYWLNLMGDRGLLGYVGAIGLHGFPGTWDSEAGSWQGWEPQLAETRAILAQHGSDAEIWITETGYSTWRGDALNQAERFLDALAVSADRIYWYSWRDVPRDVAVQEGLWFDPRHYHLGAVDASGRPKLLARLLVEGGATRVREVAALSAPSIKRGVLPVLITGGSGFIGCNLADALLARGDEVLVLDNLSRPGVEQNLAWLRERHGRRVHAGIADIRDFGSIAPLVAEARAVFHLAAQTAVTTSLAAPTEDFEVNARGTLNLLEAVRAAGRQAPVIFASTNKVYGGLEDIAFDAGQDGYVPHDARLASWGLGEDRALDFCTPYGCSKGVADQYVLDYARSYGIPAAVLRMSCVYGPRQFGTEDQGWVAHFLICALEGEPISIYGDGRQVRDILHVSDAVAAYLGLLDCIEGLSGRAFNLGGGSTNAVSLLQCLAEIASILGRTPQIEHGSWRQGDQLWFVADTRALQAATGWQPLTPWREGLRDLASWLQARHPIAFEPLDRRMPA